MNDKNKIVIYQTDDGQTQIDVRFDTETIWLSQKQMGELFEKDSDTIGLHLKNIYSTGELEEKSTTEKYSVVQKEGKRRVKRKIKFYNLDATISVGYRVNSKRGTQFRIWANKVLREYLVQGFVINEKQLTQKAGATELFGAEKDDSFKGSLENIYQTFEGKDLYPSLELKATHLLYFVVKNHSFVDGNKRIAAFLFIWFLEKNNFLYDKKGQKILSDDALVAITLMLAESNPEDKETLIRVIVKFFPGQ